MIKKILKIAAIAIVLVLIGLQFYQPNQTNPTILEAETLEASTTLPADVAAIMKRSCADCHTNTTVYPWYSKISPVSWFLNGHIQDGRRHLNLSVWVTSQPKRRIKKLEEICEQLETKEMPLPSYLWLHRDAVMSDEDSKILCDWAMSEKTKLTLE